MSYRPCGKKPTSLLDSITSFVTALALTGMALAVGVLAPKFAMALVVTFSFLSLWWSLRELP